MGMSASSYRASASLWHGLPRMITSLRQPYKTFSAQVGGNEVERFVRIVKWDDSGVLFVGGAVRAHST